MAQNRLKFSLTSIDKLSFAEVGKQVDYWDTELKGFGCRVSSTTKTYFVMKRVNGKLTRVSLGRHGIMRPDKARAQAVLTLGQLSSGVDINREKSLARVRGVTLTEVYEKYLTTRPSMKAHTIRVDRSLINCHLSDWANKPIQEITREMVANRHIKIAQSSGEVTANNAMRLVRRLYNFALSIADGNMPPNPVQRLSDSRQWFKVGRRQTVLKEHELSLWYAAVQNLDNPTASDYLLLLLFTGLRKNEALSLAWRDVDITGKTFTIRQTKNGKPHTLPMSDFIYELFKRRLALRENDYVFPGGNSNTRHLVEPKRQVQAVIDGTGIPFCLHDLRRTFASIAEGVVSYSVLKRLMNHSDKDVTQGYIVISTEKLRSPMQLVSKTIQNIVLTKA